MSRNHRPKWPIFDKISRKYNKNHQKSTQKILKILGKSQLICNHAYIHEFLSKFYDSKCEKTLNSSNFSNLKSPARAKTFARQKIIMKEIDGINSVFFMRYLLKMMDFTHVHASARTPDTRSENFDECRRILHFESSKYLKNR